MENVKYLPRICTKAFRNITQTCSKYVISLFMTMIVYMYKAFKPCKVGKIWHERQNVRERPVNIGRKEDTNKQKSNIVFALPKSYHVAL